MRRRDSVALNRMKLLAEREATEQKAAAWERAVTYWNAKPRAAQAARSPIRSEVVTRSETILNYGHPHMVDAIARANTIEQAAQKAADDLGVDVEVVRVWIQLTDDERATLRAEWKQKHRTKGHKREMKVR